MRAFAFYDPNCAPAITLTGQSIVTTLIQSFEMFLADNWHFSDPADVLEFTARYAGTAEKSDVECEFEGPDLTVGHIAKRLWSKMLEGSSMPTPAMHKELLSRLSEMNIRQRRRVYYRNNLIAFLQHPTPIEALGECLSYDLVSGNEDEIDDPDAKDALGRLWALVNEFVVSTDLWEPRMNFCEDAQRRAVLLSDTDSTFLNLQMFVDHVLENFEVDMSTTDRYVSVVNVGVYILSMFSPAVLYDWAERCGMQEERRKWLSLKNEFLYSRILLTSNKKHYAGLIANREGVPLDPPELDVKGMKIKTIKVPKVTREFFKKVVERDVLGTEQIDLTVAVSRFVEFEGMVRKAFVDGLSTFAIPTKYSGIGNYAKPYTQEVVRGTLVWNALFPRESIQGMDMTQLVKLKTKDVESFEAAAQEVDLDKWGKTIDTVRKTCFENENMEPYGFSRFAMPFGLPELPEWLLPFIDVRAHVDYNVRNAIIILESLGVECLEVRNVNRHSNLVSV